MLRRISPSEQGLEEGRLYVRVLLHTAVYLHTPEPYNTWGGLDTFMAVVVFLGLVAVEHLAQTQKSHPTRLTPNRSLCLRLSSPPVSAVGAAAGRPA